MSNITFFGDMLISSDFLSEEDTFICFMVIAMSCFLFPSYNDQIHTEFLTLLVDSKRTSGFFFCALVYDWILTGINKYVIFGRVTGSKPKVFDFCSYCIPTSIFILVYEPGRSAHSRRRQTRTLQARDGVLPQCLISLARRFRCTST